VFGELLQRLRHHLPQRVDGLLGLTPDDDLSHPASDAFLGDATTPPETPASLRSRWRPNPATLTASPPLTLRPPRTTPDPDSLVLHWIMATHDPGNREQLASIAAQIRALDTNGHRQTVWVRPPWTTDDPVEALEQGIGPQPQWRALQVAFLPDKVLGIEGDAVIATDWGGVYPALGITNVYERFLLLRDAEPEAQTTASERLLAHGCLSLGLAVLCKGAWLEDLLRSRGISSIHGWDDALNLDAYFPRPTRTAAARTGRGLRQPRPPRRHIAFHHQPGSQHWASELGLSAFSLLLQHGADFHVHLFGAPAPDGLPFPHTDHGELPPHQLGALYRSCDLGLILHTGDPSQAVLEMMHCSLPVATLDTPATRHGFSIGALIPVSGYPPKLAKQLADIDTFLLDATSARADAMLDGTRRAPLDRLELALLKGLGLAGEPSPQAPQESRLQRRIRGLHG